MGGNGLRSVKKPLEKPVGLDMYQVMMVFDLSISTHETEHITSKFSKTVSISGQHQCSIPSHNFPSHHDGGSVRVDGAPLL